MKDPAGTSQLAGHHTRGRGRRAWARCGEEGTRCVDLRPLRALLPLPPHGRRQLLDVGGERADLAWVGLSFTSEGGELIHVYVDPLLHHDHTAQRPIYSMCVDVYERHPLNVYNKPGPRRPRETRASH